jgi:hypothetical protein
MSNQENKSNLWKVYGLLMGLMLVGSALILGGQATRRMWQERQASSSVPIATEVPVAPSSNINESPETIAPTTATPSPTARDIQPSSPTARDIQPSVQTEQVSFAPGTSGANLQDTVAVGQIRRYLLNCGTGQTMRIRTSQGSVRILIKSPNDQVLGEIAEGGNLWQGSLPTDGDYQIDVSSSSSSNYLIAVEVL